MLIDTHAHLQWRSFDRDRREIIDRARQADVKQIVNIGFDVETSLKAIRMAEEYDGLFATVGVHPHNASQFNETALRTMMEMCQHPKVVAIGETGLDYYRNLSPVELQKKAFEAQMLLAEELNLPVVIHDREAHPDILEMLKRFAGKVKGIMHCFSGDREMAELCLRSGFLVSFTGVVTYANTGELGEAAKAIDLSSVLLETDCPWLTPMPMRGKRNESAFLVHTARKIAELRGIPLSELAEATTRNARNVFQLP